MYDPSRLRGLFPAVAAVGLALAGLGLVAHAGAGGRPAWLASGDSTIESGQEAIVGGKVAGAIARSRADGSGPSDLGVILGSSAVSMAFDPRALEAEAGPRIPARWLSLYANGANVEDLRGLADYLLRGKLRPRVLVLGLHPGLLARSDDYLTDATTFEAGPLRERLEARELLGAKAELQALSAVPLNWAFPNRTRVSNRVRNLAASAKRGLFARLGMGAEALYRADRDPWTARPLIPDEPEAKRAEAEGRTATVRDQAEGPMRVRLGGDTKDKGWFKPGSYSPDGANARALVEVVREARSRGIDVAIALLPERSSLRAILPPEALATLREALRRDLGPEAPAVIDLREAVDDSLFFDNVHERKPSRAPTTRKLAEGLRARPDRAAK